MPSVVPLVTAVAEPVTAQTAIAFAKRTDAEAPIVELLIPPCRHAIEEATGLILASRDFRLTYDREELLDRNGWPRRSRVFGWGVDAQERTVQPSTISLAIAPVTAIVTVKAYDTDDAETVIASADYALDGDARPSRLRLDRDAVSALLLRDTASLVIQATAGYTEATIPPNLKLAILRTIATNIEHPENIVAGTIAARVPDVAMELIQGSRIWVL